MRMNTIFSKKSSKMQFINICTQINLKNIVICKFINKYIMKINTIKLIDVPTRIS